MFNLFEQKLKPGIDYWVIKIQFDEIY
jgi:hypothetical protein